MLGDLVGLLIVFKEIFQFILEKIPAELRTMVKTMLVKHFMCYFSERNQP